MGIFKSFNKIMHRFLERQYLNCLPDDNGTYIAGIENWFSLGIGQICAHMRDRGGFSGDLKTLTENVRQFLDEAAYLLCEGYSVNMGYFSVHPDIRDVFNSVDEERSGESPPVTFNFRIGAKLDKLARQTAVDITGLAESNAFIDKFIDFQENITNSLYTPGDLFTISGNKIKVAGDNPGCGVYFVPVENPNEAIKVTRLEENSHSRITGVAPITKYTHNKIEIVTQYTGSPDSFLKLPRTITSGFTVEAV